LEAPQSGVHLVAHHVDHNGHAAPLLQLLVLLVLLLLLAVPQAEGQPLLLVLLL
jgi:hypothetical protein